MNQSFILIKPLVTEKSLAAQKLNIYSFEVSPKADKNQIRVAVETMFKVNVTKVRTSILKGVTKRTGRKRLPTKTQTQKKALVTLKPGQSIAVFEVKA